MAYNLRNVIDVANKLQSMPPDRKTFGYGLALISGVAPEGSDVVMGPYTSADGIAEELGSNSEAVRIATTYFSGGWFGKPYQLYVAFADTETLDSLLAWTPAQSYQVGDKVKSEGSAYICTFANVSSGTFSTELWKPSAEPIEGAVEWEENTAYTAGTAVKVLVEEEVTEGESGESGESGEGGAEVYEYYICNFSHISGTSFTTTCWEAYEPTGKPMSEWMTDFLGSSKNYYVFLPSIEFKTADLLAVASKVESASTPKMAIFTYTGADAFDNSTAEDLGSLLKDLNYDRSMTIYEPVNASGVVNYVSAAVLSGYATVSFTSARPSITMADKVLKGVTALNLTDAQYAALQSKNYNFYTVTTDIETDMFIDTRMASGQFFDTIQAADWLAYDMKYKLVNLVQNRDKIPFTEDGLAMIKQTLSETCVEALNAGIIGSGYDQDNNYIENGYKIDMPALSSIPKADKAKRILRDVKVTFLLAGAVQVINVLNDIQL